MADTAEDIRRVDDFLSQCTRHAVVHPMGHGGSGEKMGSSMQGRYVSTFTRTRYLGTKLGPHTDRR